jgi:hypothetical protein
VRWYTIVPLGGIAVLTSLAVLAVIVATNIPLCG